MNAKSWLTFAFGMQILKEFNEQVVTLLVKREKHAYGYK